MLTIIIFFIVLSILVFVHELGHFGAARIFGMIPKEFGFGFPPRLWGVYKDENGKWRHVKGKQDITGIKSTVYSINWIPIGGFVNVGEDDINDTGPHTFMGKKIWQRIVILSAGVAMNVLLTAVLFSAGYMIGFPQIMDGRQADSKAIVMERKIQVTDVLPDSPAQKAGVQFRDAITSINGVKFDNYEDFIKYIEDKAGQELVYKIKRGKSEIEKKITPAVIEETGKPGIGIAITGVEIVKYPWYYAIWKGFQYTILLLGMIAAAFYELIKGLFMGQGVGGNLAGPVGIAKLTGDASRMGFAYLLQFTALLSANLAVINFLPIPALDGGRVLFLIFEKFKGRPMKRELEIMLHNVFFILLILLVLIVTLRDLADFEFVKHLFERIRS